MAVTLATRKPVTELTPGDLAAFPVWEFARGEESALGRDETWVRPVSARRVPRDRSSLQVATEFRAAGGQFYPGFCIVTTARGDVEIVAAIILHGGGYLLADDPEELLARTGLATAELLPITYRLLVPIDGESAPRSGILP
jgi:hypothetical protein